MIETQMKHRRPSPRHVASPKQLLGSLVADLNESCQRRIRDVEKVEGMERRGKVSRQFVQDLRELAADHQIESAEKAEILRRIGIARGFWTSSEVKPFISQSHFLRILPRYTNPDGSVSMDFSHR